MIAKPLSEYDYSWVFVKSDNVPADSAMNFPPLPNLIEPDSMPAVQHPVEERLVPIVHRKIRTLDVYWHSVWDSARPITLVRENVAKRLVSAAESLPDGFGLAILDSWRPLELQEAIYEAAYADSSLPPNFVSVPSRDPATPPPHLTGGSVDITLTYKGQPLELGTPFDDFTPQANADAFEDIPGTIRDLRRLLYWTMNSVGFIVISCEWWHFEYGTRRWAAITGQEPIYGPATPDVNLNVIAA